MSRLCVLSLFVLLAGCESAPLEDVTGRGVLVRMGFDDPSGHERFQADDFSLFVFGHPMSCAQLAAWNASFGAPLPANTPEGFSWSLFTGGVPASVEQGMTFEVDGDEPIVDTSFVAGGVLDWSGMESEKIDRLVISRDGARLFATIEGGIVQDSGRIIDQQKLIGEHDDDPREVSLAGRYELVICDGTAPPPRAE